MSDAEFRAAVWARPECRRVALVLERPEFGGPGDRGFGNDAGGVAAENRLAADVASICRQLADKAPVTRATVEQALIADCRLAANPAFRGPLSDRLINMIHAAYIEQPPRPHPGLTVEQHAAATLVVGNDLGSASMVQRHMRISFRRAVELMDQLEQAGIVGPANGSRSRTVLVTPDELAGIPTIGTTP